MSVGKKIDEIDRLEAEDCWGEYSPCPREDWKDDVLNDSTNLGYWDWVRHKIESDGE